MQVVQGTFDDLGTALSGVTFVVVDLETTGGNPQTCHITEVGAVKVRAGEVIGEFQTLVNPGEPIPAFIAVLTGITSSMVAGSPRIDSVLPAFLEFARDCVLVAHNAPFDIGFLKVAAARLGHPWPAFVVLDTAQLARQLVTRDEAPNRKLGTLARIFGAATTPDHRALHDARATVDVLHALLGRVGNLGVTTLEEVCSFTSRVTSAQRRKRFLADKLPNAPGVYVFRDESGRPLYVGTSRDIKRRVRTYFTASEQRTRMAEMVGITTSVSAIVCQTVLEAQVRELRMIAGEQPRYNRRSRHPDRQPWVKLTVEAFPRLSVVREVRPDGARYVGPFPSRAAAESAIAAVHEVVALRQCTTRLSARGDAKPCVLLEMGRCGGPCVGAQSVDAYAAVVAEAVDLIEGRSEHVVDALTSRMARLAADQRFEDAGMVRDRMMALVRAAARAQRVGPLAASPQVVAARPGEQGGWEMVCVRYGRLTGSSRSPRGADPRPYIDALVASAEVVAPGIGPAPAASVEETEMVLRWLEAAGVRIVSLDGGWSCPVHGAGGTSDRLEPLVRTARDVLGFDEPRGAGLRHRPAGAVLSNA